MLTRENAARESLRGVHTVVVDEWHELIGNKRGVQVQLALARLRRWNPGSWSGACRRRSATSTRRWPRCCGARGGALVQGRVDKALVIDTLLPRRPGPLLLGRPPRRADAAAGGRRDRAHRAPRWSSPTCARRPRSGTSCCSRRGPSGPGWSRCTTARSTRSVREWVELGLKDGRLKAVVATSTLDLGVDFLPVERVLQIGSAKGVARLLQRAGRSGHAPGRPSRVTLVPTNTLELVEAAAARRAAQAGRIESRASPDKPLDVLVQHLVTVALGGGFDADALFDEVRGAQAYRDLTRDEFDWALAFVERGGDEPGAPTPSTTACERGRRRVPRARPRHRAAPPAAGRHHRQRRGDAGEVARRAARSARSRRASSRGSSRATASSSPAACSSSCARRT